MPNFCSVKECGRPHCAKGFCSTHYRRYKRNGHPGLQPKRERAKCTAPGCVELACARGLCVKHYCRMRIGGSLETTQRDKSGIAAANPSEYKAWQHMKGRCYDPNDKSFSDYGRRGVYVCKRWLEKPFGFKHFLEDMGKKPGPQYSIDRIDNDGPYSPDNCRWATAKEQAGNRRIRRDAQLYTHNGETKTLEEWGVITGIPWSRLRCRYHSKTFDKTKLLNRRDFRVKL